MAFLTTPFVRSFVGFDNLFDELEKSYNYKETTYPAYNIEKVEDNAYGISIALAGFNEENIKIEIKQNILTINASTNNELEKKNFMHKGIATRSFSKQFRLAENIEVVDAVFKNGLLNISLIRNIPDSELPRQIQINKNVNKNPDIKAA